MEINRLKKLAGFIAEEYDASGDDQDPRYLFASKEAGTDREVTATTRRLQKLSGIVLENMEYEEEPGMAGYDDDEPLTGEEGAEDYDMDDMGDSEEPEVDQSERISELEAEVEKLTKQLEFAKDFIKKSKPSFR